MTSPSTRKLKRPQGRFEEGREACIAELRRTGNASAAYRAGGFSRSLFYQKIETDPSFRAEVEDAREEAFDNLEDLVRCRATDGYIKTKRKRVKAEDDWGCPIWVTVEVVEENMVDNGLLLRLLEANRPFKWRRHSQIEMEPGEST